MFLLYHIKMMTVSQTMAASSERHPAVPGYETAAVHAASKGHLAATCDGRVNKWWFHYGKLVFKQKQMWFSGIYPLGN